MRKTAIAAAIASALSLYFADVPMASAQLEPGGERVKGRASRPNRDLLRAGAGVLALSYLPSLVVASTSARGGDEWLYAPVIGPWADLANRQGCAAAGGSCDSEPLYRLLIISAGVVQLTGAAGIIASFVVPEYAPERRVVETMKTQVRVSPIQLSKNGYGIGVAARF